MKTIYEKNRRSHGRIRTFKGLFLRLNQILILSCLFFSKKMFADTPFEQDSSFMDERFDIDMEIKNMHLWHGSVVTPGVMIASSIEYQSSNKKFVAGLWGGASFNSEYKEFSYYAKYSICNNFSASLINHNNYSSEKAPNIFSYDKFTSPNFVDIVLEYTLPDNIPLTLYWSTILFGNGGDYETEADSSVTDSYSNYVELRYVFFPNKKTNLTMFAGGAFSFLTEKTFYSKQANFVNLGLTLSRDVKLFSKEFPVSATAFWNPESKIGALQLAISLF